MVVVVGVKVTTAPAKLVNAVALYITSPETDPVKIVAIGPVGPVLPVEPVVPVVVEFALT